MSEFKRLNKYIVIKIKDAESLPACDKRKLLEICRTVDVARTLRGKPDLECVVVENDWPEYKAVWEMIKNRVEGNPLNGWIGVDVRKPNTRDVVLVALTHDVGIWSDELLENVIERQNLVTEGEYVEGVDGESGYFQSFQACHNEHITHWMPLPESPQDASQDLKSNENKEGL
jgi:hypothetical protein